MTYILFGASVGEFQDRDHRFDVISSSLSFGLVSLVYEHALIASIKKILLPPHALSAPPSPQTPFLGESSFQSISFRFFSSPIH